MRPPKSPLSTPDAATPQTVQRQSPQAEAASPDAHVARWQNLMSDSPAVVQQVQRQQAVDTGAHMSAQRKAIAAVAGNAVVQAKVAINGVVASAPVGDKTTVGADEITLNDKAKGWVQDGYYRRYTNKTEFENHANGAPIPAGLIRKAGRWYRLKYLPGGSETKFFVLGENHGIFGYRELMRESNQPGKVLGEGGSNPLLSGALLSSNSEGLKDNDGNSREHTMENSASKAYYALALAQAGCLQRIKKAASAAAAATSSSSAPVSSTAPTGPAPRKRATLSEDAWLAGYQNAAPEKRGVGTGINKIPYYIDEDGDEVRARLDTPAGKYKTTNTIDGVVDSLLNKTTELAAKLKNPTYTSKFTPGVTKILVSIIPKITTDLAAITVLAKAKPINDAALSAGIGGIMPLLSQLSKIEADPFNVGSDYDWRMIGRTEAAEKNLPRSYTPEQKDAFAQRDYVMYKSIVQAKNTGGYVMAGLGDDHAKNLEADLKAASIPVVRFEEFVGSMYSEDALLPAASTAPPTTSASAPASTSASATTPTPTTANGTAPATSEPGKS